jgi:hypothetical protein
MLVLVAGCGGAPSSDLLYSPGGTELIETNEHHITRSGASIDAARKHAESLLHSAAHKTKDPQSRELFSAMETALGRAKIDVPPPGRDLRACTQDPATLAFVNSLDRGIIHVCARAASASESRLGQVLIHETAHVVGINDECDATRVEVAVQRSSSGRLPFRNGYMERCGIR